MFSFESASPVEHVIVARQPYPCLLFHHATEFQPFGKALGNFRVELRKATTSANDSLTATAKRAHAEIVSAEEQATKAQKARLAEQRSAEQVVAKPANSGADADADDMAVDDQDVAWGEIDGMWKDVWDSIKFLRKHAIDHESGRRLSELRKLDLRSQNNVIVTLYNYGWFEDRPSDIALEMLAIYLRHRSASATITTGELRECRKLYEEWNKLVSAS